MSSLAGTVVIYAFVCFNAQVWRYRHLAKNSAQTDARGRLELAVRCECLLHVEGLIVTLRWRTAINSSILGFISLCQLVKGGGNSINPGFLNSDLVENFFDQQRGIRNGLNSNPTLAQYGPSNTTIIIGHCSVSNKCNSGKSASFFKATTPCALNKNRNKSIDKGRRLIWVGTAYREDVSERVCAKKKFL